MKCILTLATYLLLASHQPYAVCIYNISVRLHVDIYNFFQLPPVLETTFVYVFPKVHTDPQTTSRWQGKKS